MEKKLQIVIIGEQKTGKSIMMYCLEKLLRENGFVVDIQFKDPFTPKSDFNDIHDFHKIIGDNYDEKLKLLKNNTKIILNELTIKNKNDSEKEEDYRTKTKTTKKY